MKVIETEKKEEKEIIKEEVSKCVIIMSINTAHVSVTSARNRVRRALIYCLLLFVSGH